MLLSDLLTKEPKESKMKKDARVGREVQHSGHEN